MLETSGMKAKPKMPGARPVLEECSDSLWLRAGCEPGEVRTEKDLAVPIYSKYAEAGVAATSNGLVRIAESGPRRWRPS